MMKCKQNDSLQDVDNLQLCGTLQPEQWQHYLEQRHRLLLAELQTLRSMLGYRPIMTGSQERKQAIGIVN